MVPGSGCVSSPPRAAIAPALPVLAPPGEPAVPRRREAAGRGGGGDGALAPEDARRHPPLAYTPQRGGGTRTQHPATPATSPPGLFRTAPHAPSGLRGLAAAARLPAPELAYTRGAPTATPLPAAGRRPAPRVCGTSGFTAQPRPCPRLTCRRRGAGLRGVHVAPQRDAAAAAAAAAPRSPRAPRDVPGSQRGGTTQGSNGGWSPPGVGV